MGKFIGRILIENEKGKEELIAIYDADIKEEKIIEVSLEKFKNDFPCVIERRNCELTVAEKLIRRCENMEKEKALEIIMEYVDNKIIDIIYE